MLRQGPSAFALQNGRIAQVDEAILQTSNTDWTRMWNGMSMLTRSFSPETLLQHKTLLEKSPYSAFALETRAVLSIMACYADAPFVFMELGSGRAPWCLTVAGIIEHGLLPFPPKSCFALALEAEPTHYEWTKTHLIENNIRSMAIHGAIGAKPGQCRFQTSPDPAAHMGQYVSPKGNIEVPVFTIDQLITRAALSHVNAIHMDVQGQEAEAIRGAHDALRRQRIDFFIIGTHGPSVEQELKDLLQPTHDLLVELPMRGSVLLPGFTEPFTSNDYGVHVYRRKELAK